MILHDAIWWLPSVAVIAVSTIAAAAVLALPGRPAKRYWIAAVLAGCLVAIGVTLWQQKTSRTAMIGEAERLRDLGAHLDDLGKLLPNGPGTTPGETFDTVAAALVSLKAKIGELENQIHALQEKSRNRSIAAAAAAEASDYLRGFGSHRVVVSCAPDDLEAFGYANQIANILRTAGWDALGPEKTAIFGKAPAVGVRLYTGNASAAQDTARILIEAFTRFNIPYQSGVAASEAIPDPGTVELFVGPKA